MDVPENLRIAASLAVPAYIWADTMLFLYNSTPNTSVDREVPFEKRRVIGILSYLGKHTKCPCHPRA